MKIAVLGGAGKMGTGIVRDLVSKESQGIERVIVADANIERAKKLVEELKSRKVEATRLNVTNKEEAINLLKRADVCMNAVPTFVGHQMDIFHYCLEARCPYLDLGGMGIYTEKQKAEHEKWVKKEIPAIVALGSDPGLSNMLCKAVAEKLDEINKINLYWAAKLIGPESPVFVPPYSILTLLGEYAHNSKQFINGKLVERPPQSGKQTLVLPQPFGEMEFIHSQHSEVATVPFAKGIKDKGIKEFTWRLHLADEEHEVIKSLIKVGFGDFNQPLKIKGMEILPGEFLEALIERNIEKNKNRIPEQTDYEMHFAIGEGKKGGKNTKVTCILYSFPDPFFEDYNDPATSMSASIGAQMLGREKIPPGVWGPEECLEVKEFFSELKKRHFRITMKTEIEEEM